MNVTHLMPSILRQVSDYIITSVNNLSSIPLLAVFPNMAIFATKTLPLKYLNCAPQKHLASVTTTYSSQIFFLFLLLRQEIVM